MQWVRTLEGTSSNLSTVVFFILFLLVFLILFFVLDRRFLVLDRTMEILSVRTTILG